MTVSFEVHQQDLDLINEIANRAEQAGLLGYQATRRRRGDAKLTLTMDLVACHVNACRLRLSELVEADNFNFTHDIVGIQSHLNRETGKLEDSFLPRYADLI